jgi:quinohemoprotein ethanol dehydrogenase
MTFTSLPGALRQNCPSLLLLGLVGLLLATGCKDNGPESGQAAAAPDAPPVALAGAGQVDTGRLLGIASEPGSWLTPGRDFGKTHHSPLRQINRDNVTRVGFAWEYETGTQRGLEATPQMVDGVVYASGNWGEVYAVDARSGQQIWRFDPQVDKQWGRYACCDAVNRGVSVWKGRVYVAALDGRVFALDAATGTVDWVAESIDDQSRAYTVTGATQVAGDVVVIGNSGAEFDARGYITAFDLETGERRWRFYTVPGDPSKPYEHPELEQAAKTWDPQSRWDVGGGGTVWDAMVYDPELDLLYVGTGNAALYNAKERSPSGGDNLYLASILAIDPDDGRLVWHYQEVPGESWDYTATQHIMLADIELQGRQRKVLMQAPKNGFFYVLDRATGELLSADPYVAVTWAEGIDMATGRPIFSPQADYTTGPKLIYPSMGGGHNWNPMAYSPDTGLVYIPAIEAGMLYFDPTPGQHDYLPKSVNIGVVGLFREDLAALPPELDALLPPVEELLAGQPEEPTRTVLRAWDPVRREVAWEVERGEWWNVAGVLSTGANLVVQGEAMGMLSFFDGSNGELLHEIDTGTSIVAAPASYELDGEQYIVVMAGFGGAVKWQMYPPETAAYQRGNAGRLLAFKLGGGTVPKPAELPPLDPIPEPPPLPQGADVARGNELFDLHCALCHFNTGRGRPSNLYYMSAGTHAAFDAIVRGGGRVPLGMPRFDDVLSAEDAEAIRAALITRASDARKAEQQAAE